MAEKTFHSLTLPGQDTARVPLTAVEFNTSTAYKVKDYCTYQGKLYRCTVAHAAGAWNASHFVETNMDAELDRKLDIPPSQASAPANPRVGDLWIDNDENSPIYNVDAAPILGSTNAVQSGGTKTALNAIDSRKVEHGCITGDFSASVDYRVGDLVFYATTANGITTRTLYRCTTAHNSTAWNASHFIATTLEVELQRVRDNEADTDMIGDLFGAKTTYAVGDYCIYNDNLYRCIQAVDNTGVTTPAFDPDDWTQVALANDVSDLKSALNNLTTFNSYDLLKQFPKPTRSTSNITVIWDGDVATVNGKATSTFEALCDFYNNTTALPNGFRGSQKIFIHVSTSSSYLRLAIIPYISGVAQPGTYFTEDGEYTLPDGTTGLIIRLNIVQNNTLTNSTFSAQILTAPSNAEIAVIDAKEAVLANNISDLKNVIKKNNSWDVLAQFPKPSKNTSNITIVWNDDTATINGKATSTEEANNSYYSNTIALPDGITAGQHYYVEVKSSKPNYARLGIIPYISGVAQTAQYYGQDGEITLPEGTSGIILRLALTQNVVFNGDTFTAKLSTNLSNEGLQEEIVAVQNEFTAYGSVELVKDRTDLTHMGINFVWTGNVCAVSGTSTGVAINNIYYNASALPDNITPGETLFLRYKTEDKLVRCGVAFAVGDVMQPFTYLTQDSVIQVPNNATGFALRLSISQNLTINTSVICALYTAKTNRMLQSDIATLMPFNAQELLHADSTANKTHNGVTYSWTNSSICTASGTAGGNSLNNFFSNYDALPDGIKPGDSIFVDFSTTDQGIRYGIYFYDSGKQNIGTTLSTTSGSVKVPATAVGAIFRLTVANGVTVNGTAEIHVLSAASNRWLDDQIPRVTALEARVGTTSTTPMLTIIDDDGNSLFYTDLYPLVETKKVPIACAIPYSNIGTANHLTLDQVKEMYGNGVEILSHTYSHWIDFSGKTEADFEADYRKAKHSFNLIGIPCKLLVYSASSGNLAAAKEAASRVYDGAIASGNQHINYSDANKWFIERYGINGDGSDGRLNGESLTSLTSAIDTLVENGGWMVWMTHTSGNYWSATMLDNISSTIDYALSKGVQIVTAVHGFKTYFGCQG